MISSRVAPALPGFRHFSSTIVTRKPISLLPRGKALKHEHYGQDEKLRLIMFGKPGAGKGTLTSRLVKKYDIMSLSTGDILRQNIAEGTEVGKIAEDVVARGGLLSDDIMLKVVTGKLDSLHSRNWVLDGFPRTVGQGKMLNEHLRSQMTPLTLIINLDVADEIILNRISERYVHLPSGRVYNTSFNPPKVDGRDDITGEPLTKRPDDNPATFARRLEQFYAATSPLLSYYSEDPLTNTKLVTLKGETSDQIWPQLDTVVSRSFPGLVDLSQNKKRASLADPVLARADRAEQGSASSTRPNTSS